MDDEQDEELVEGRLHDGPITMSYEDLMAWNFTRVCIVRRCRAQWRITPTLDQMLGIDFATCPECGTHQLINDNAEIGAGLRKLLRRIERLEASLASLRKERAGDKQG